LPQNGPPLRANKRPTKRKFFKPEKGPPINRKVGNRRLKTPLGPIKTQNYRPNPKVANPLAGLKFVM